TEIAMAIIVSTYTTPVMKKIRDSVCSMRCAIGPAGFSDVWLPLNPGTAVSMEIAFISATPDAESAARIRRPDALAAVPARLLPRAFDRYAKEQWCWATARSGSV